MCSSDLEVFSVCAMRGHWVLLALAFFFAFVSCFSSSVFFLSICPSLPFYLCLKGSVLIEDPCFFILCRDLFLDASLFSGLQDPLGLSFILHGSSVPIVLGLA